MNKAAPYQLFSASDAVLAHPVATFVIDGNQRIIEANPSAEQLSNVARTHLIGEAITSVVRTREFALQAVLEGSGKSFTAYDVVTEIGKAGQQTVDLLISPAHPEGYRMIALSHGSDAASGRHLRPGSAARSATGAAAILAHEIKNPLSGIRGAAQLMENANPEDITRFSKLICSEVDRIAALIDTMQNFTREQPLNISSQNIYPAISQACGVAKAGFANNVRFQEDYDPSLPDALICHDSLVQILINLLKNASEALASTDDPMIKVSTAYRHGLSYDAGDGKGRIALPVEVSVTDNGPGVPLELADDMFSPFVTGRALGDGDSRGQGLGLAMVDKLVREMGGLVHYHRDGLKHLSHFRIHLPTIGSAHV